MITTQDITKIYKIGDISVHALNGVSLTIDDGEFIAVMGASGSGKTTFMNILGCLDSATKGTYNLDGKEVTGLSPAERAIIRNKMIGFVFQNFNLLSRTSALENVELPMIYNGTPAVARRERARELLRLMHLEGRESHYPSQLSGGQQQRIAIARALVNHPSLILADEPTGNLDTVTSSEIMEIFRKLNTEKGLTIVLVTHENDIAEYADRLIRFRDGRVIEDKRK